MSFEEDISIFDKIENPMNHISADNPQRDNPRYIEGLKKHWAKEIENFKDQIKRAENEQKRRQSL